MAASSAFPRLVLGGVVVVLAILIFAIYGKHPAGHASVKLDLPSATASRSGG